MNIRRRTRTKRGFSLLEIVVVIAIVSLLAGIAIPAFSRAKMKAQLRSTANRMVGDFKQARTLAASGKAGLAAWAADQRTQMAGIRFISATQYAIFIDNDNAANGSEVDIEVVDIAANNEPFVFVGAPAEVRFKRTGTLVAPPDVDIIVQDTTTNEQRTVRITYGGKASVFL